MCTDVLSYRARIGCFYGVAAYLSRKLSFLTAVTLLPFCILCFGKGSKSVTLSLYIFLFSMLIPQLFKHAFPPPAKACRSSFIFSAYDYIIAFTRASFLSFSSLLLLMSGDVESNPGPAIQGDICVMHANVRSLKRNIDLLSAESNQYDVITLSETWLTNETLDNTTKIQLPNFHPPVRLDRDDGYGGVAIYIKCHLVCKPRPDLYVDGLEAVWVETKVNKQSLLIGSVYRSPDRLASYWDLLSEGLRKVNNTGLKFMFLGDINTDWLNSPSKHYSDTLQLFQLHQLVKTPTRITPTSSTCVDHIVVQNPQLIKAVDVAPPFCSDHSVPFVILHSQQSTRQLLKRQIFNYNKLDKEKFCNLLYAVDWENIFIENSIDESAQIFTDTLMSAAKKCMPVKNVVIRENDAPWMTAEIRFLILQRNRMYKRALHSRLPNDMANFRIFRNKIISKIRNRKLEYLNSLNDKISDPLNFGNKDWWKLVNIFLHKKGINHDEIPPLQYKDHIYYSNEEKAQVLNEFFVEQCTLVGNDDPLPPVTPKNPELYEIILTPLEVKATMKKLKRNKATGPDHIHNFLLVTAADVLAGPLTLFFNRCLRVGVFPNCWKHAHVTPIYKKGDRDNCTNYRPVSLLSCVGKLLERCIHTHLYEFFTGNNILSSAQSGFIRGDSTIFQLLSIYNNYIVNYDRNITTQAVYFDLSKAFDRVWHRGLLLKLEANGIRGPLLRFIENYLSGRTQSVVVKGVTSDAKLVPAGVPQGSVLGPLFFLIYINDIVLNIESTIKLFADDTSVSSSVGDSDLRSAALNSDLEKIHTWANTWKLKFNEDKTELLNFKRGPLPVNDLHFGNVTLKETKSHKHLGLIIQCDCRWGEHIDAVARKVNMLIACLRGYKYSLSRKALETMYKSFILPIFDYADVIWDNCTEGQSTILEKLHLEALRIIVGGVKGTSHYKLYEESGFTSLKERRKNHRLILFFKIVNGLCPDYLLEDLPNLVSTTNPYHRRRPYERLIPPVRTELYKNSFFPRTTTEWNSLPDNMKTSSSLSEFKRLLNTFCPSVPLYYYYGKRTEQILHCRLRLGISNLNNDLYNRHLKNNPACLCGHPFENCDHYLFKCPLYNDARLNTIFTLNLPQNVNLDLNVLLFGSPLLSLNMNTAVFASVQDYIKSTKRFI